MDLRVAGFALILATAILGCGVAPVTPGPSTSASGASSPLASATAGRSLEPVRSAAPSATAVLPRIGGTWASGTRTPTRRAENAAVALDGVIYVAGGMDGDGKTLDLFEAYDTRTDTWTTLPPLPEPRDHMGLVAVVGQIYLTGGGVFYQPAARSGLWRYDPKARHWSALPPMPANRWQHASVVLDGRIYVVGGVTDGDNPRAVWAYDIAGGTWVTDIAPLPTEREHLTAVAANGMVIAIGGRKIHQIGAVEAYDPKTNAWKALPDLPTPRGGSAAGLIGDVIHVAGGENLNDSTTYAQHEALDLATMAWSKGPDLPTKRHGVASAVVDGRWYVIGGGRAAGLSVSDFVEVYTP
jgi:non-specific serine/threonine protein kinase